MPYDKSVALEALAWLKDLEARTEAPAPEMSGVFCQSYCDRRRVPYLAKFA
jgi:hypothetical protein